MDITLNDKKLYSNKIINGETVNYLISSFISFFVLIATKQVLKTFFGVDKTIAVVIGFILFSVSTFLLERFLVFKDNSLNGDIAQVLFAVFRSAVDFGFYKLSDMLFGKMTKKEDCFVFFMASFIIFFFNYFFDRLVVFDVFGLPYDKKNGRIYKKFFSIRFVLLSMLIASLAITFIYSIFKLFPFGDTTILRMDLYHQYGPLFVELFDRVVEHKSFLYSWTSGGGSSFLGNFFNYLSSPLSAVIFLFDRKEMAYAITFLATLKAILSAGTFTYYIKKSLNRHSLASSAFGVFYAFSAYFLAYYWNIMWLDGMILFPLIILGIERIINKADVKLYIISLVLLLYSSYYMGFMACIFSVVYFFAYFSMTKNYSGTVCVNLSSGKQKFFTKAYNNMFVNRALKFASASVLVGLISAVFLIPIYFVLSGCSATSDSLPSSFESYFTIFDFIETHLAGLETTIRSSGNDVLPNVYCGMLTLVLLPLFIVNKDIKLKEKVVYVVLILFFVFCFDNNYANFIWHAFHFPNDLPYRYSYMYSFILLVVAFKSLMHIKSIGIKEIGFSGFLWLLFIAVAEEMPTEKMSSFSVYLSLAFIIIWTGALFILKKTDVGKLVIGTTILAVTFCEVIISDTNSFVFSQNQTNYVKNYDTYTDAIDYLKENDKSFHREELCSLNTRMDACLYDYSGISTFSSMAYEKYSRLQYSLGMYGNRINSYTYNTQTPVYNMMYAIKYLIYHDEDTRPSTDLYTKYYKTTDNETTVYENDFYLPISYCVNPKILDWDTTEGNPFRLQNDFFSLATGYSDVFKSADYVDISYDNLFGDDVSENGTYWYEKGADSDYGYINITLSAKTDGNFYLYTSSSDITNISCETNSGTVTQEIETPYILDLGYHNKGDKIIVSLDGGNTENNEGSFEMYAYSIDKEVLQKGYSALSETAIDITDYSSTKISGTITAKENSVVYSSIPYDEGWSVYIDGQKEKTFSIGDSQLGFMIKPGEHEITYKYSPKGLSYGAIISSATLLCGAAYYIYSKKRNQKMTI